jgi:hypothetical protein
MNSKVRNVLAVIIGIAVMMFVNSGLVQASAFIIPPPEGVDPMDIESIKANFDKFTTKHYIVPFLAHALGSIAGVVVGCSIAASHKFKIAMGLGIFHLLGGIAAAVMIPAPLWFIVVDLVLAYIPMAWLGTKLSGVKK